MHCLLKIAMTQYATCFAGQQFLKSKFSQAVASGTKLPAGLVQHLLASAKQVQGLQNAAAAASLLENRASTEDSRLQALLTGSITSAVDSLPEPLIDTMGADLLSANKIVGAMQELGYACTSSEATFRNLLKQFTEFDEQAVAEVLGLMARTVRGLEPDSLGLAGTLNSVFDTTASSSGHNSQGDSGTGWNYAAVVDAFKSRAPDLSWARVIECLDYEGFTVPDGQGFILLISAYRRATTDPFPLAAVVGRLWTNTAGQLSFLQQAVLAPPDVFTFESSQQKLPPVEGLAGGKSPLGTPNQAWVSLDLISTLCQLADAGHFAAVRQMLDTPIKACPEVLLLSVAAVRQDANWSLLERTVWSSLAPVYLSNNPNSGVVLHQLWDKHPVALTQAMVEWYVQDASHISRILDVCQELKALTQVLDATPASFACELAALASRREYLNLEKWLNDHISQDGLPFVAAAVSFVDQKTTGNDTLMGQLNLGMFGRVNLAPETLAIYLKVLQSQGLTAAPELGSEIARVQAQALESYPHAATLLASSTSGVGLGMALGGLPLLPGETSFPEDIEEEANGYFQKIYSAAKPVDDVIDMLKGFIASSNLRQQQVFACMVHNLFDEYRFFVSYPDKELAITAHLFGALLHHQLLAGRPDALAVALEHVLRALSDTTDSKMFSFGLQALNQFKGDLHLWPAFCAKAAAIPQLRIADPALVTYMEKIAAADSSSNLVPLGSTDLLVGVDSLGSGLAAVGASLPAIGATVPSVGVLPATSSADSQPFGSAFGLPPVSSEQLIAVSSPFTGFASTVSAPGVLGLSNGDQDTSSLIGPPVSLSMLDIPKPVSPEPPVSAPADTGTSAVTAANAATNDKPAAAPNGTAVTTAPLILPLAAAAPPASAPSSTLASISEGEVMNQSQEGGMRISAEDFKDIIGNQNVAQAAAASALQEPPKSMSLVTINAETLERCVVVVSMLTVQDLSCIMQVLHPMWPCVVCHCKYSPATAHTAVST